jgi:hypothetical protein
LVGRVAVAAAGGAAPVGLDTGVALVEGSDEAPAPHAATATDKLPRMSLRRQRTWR